LPQTSARPSGRLEACTRRSSPYKGYALHPGA